jgi:gliding motility-associated-like protein
VIDSVTDVSCFGASDGAIETTISGGTIPYTISWTPGGGATEDTTGLATGFYQITVTDDDGCIIIADTTVATPALIVGTTSGTDPLCNGDSTGTATVALVGGSGGYTIEWFDTTGTTTGQTTATAIDLPAGCYYAMIADSAAPACSVLSDTVCISDPAVISFTTASIDMSCFGTCDGEVSWTASGGVGVITSDLYLVGTPDILQIDSTILCAGDYYVVHTDTNLCVQSSDTVTVTEPALIVGTTSGTDPLCIGDSTGTASVAIVGGSGGYDVEWFDTAGISIGQLTDTAVNLPAGCYYALITDTAAAGCSVISDTVCIVDPLAITFTTTPTDATCFGVCDGEVAWTVSGGVGVITSDLYLIGTPDVLQADSSTLCPGDYFVVHTDTNLCVQNSDTVTISEPTLMVGTTSGTDPLCNGDSTGTASVALVGGSGGYTIEWFDTTGTTTGQTTATAIDLPAGCYYVVITDTAALSCSVNSDTICLTDPAVISFTTASIDMSCFGTCDGEVSWTASGGVGTITSELYLIGTPDVLQLDSTTLCAGDYYVLHTDTNLCEQNSDTVTVTEPALIVGTTGGADPLCTGDSTGTAWVDIVGGTGTYSVVWYDTSGTAIGQVTDTAFNLPAGCYYVEISNAVAPLCTVLSDTICLSDPLPITFTTTPADVTCFNACNGSVSWTAAGGSGTITSELYYIATPDSLLGSINPTDSLCPGDYYVVHTDTNLCVQVSDTVSIAQPTDLVAGMPVISDASCVAACNGSATLNISGGSGSYTYSWSSGSIDSVVVDDLCVGITDVLVTDSLGCTVSQSITINENNTITGTSVTTDATCGLCDGDATVTPSGGLGSYSIAWSDGSTGISSDSLCAGVYSYVITDSVGCSVTMDAAISNTGGPTSGVVNVTDVTCYGAADGTADITPAGGLPPYTYLWVPGGETTNAVTGLQAGSYSVEVMDSNGCILVENAVIGSPAAIAIESLVINEDCGQSNGSIEIVPNGGSAPYNYAWTGGALPPDSIQSGLVAGIYQVAVTDFSGCSDTFNIVVNAAGGPSISLSSEDASCFGTCNGIGTVVASGGSGFFSYQWSGGGTNPADSTLCAGMHTVTVIDDTTGCVTTSFVLIGEPDSISMSFPNLVNVTCFGFCNGAATVVASGGTLPYSYSWPGTGTTASDSLLCADTLVVNITDGAGCTQTEEVIILEPTPVAIALDSINASCTGIADGGVNAVVTGGTPGYSYSWTGTTSPLPDNDTIIDLLSGTYYLTVTDSLGCVAMDSTIVNDTIFVVPDAGLDTAICFGTGPLTLTGAGMAVSFEWYDMNGAQISAADTLDVDSTGCYILLGIDGICSNMDTICVVIDSLPVPDAGEDHLLISGQSVGIGGSPTTDPLFDVLWFPPNYLDDTNAMNPYVMAIDTPTVYVVMVTDTNGCVGYDTVFVDLYPDIFTPTGISPNGDGINDDWEIDFIGEYPDCQVEVYNRWGQQLFYNQGYTQRWDGRYNGKDLPEGTYYYVIRLNHPAYPEPYTGPVTILR